MPSEPWTVGSLVARSQPRCPVEVVSAVLLPFDHQGQPDPEALVAHLARTFSDFTTAPRHGPVSDCDPLEPFYTDSPEQAELAELKARLAEQ